MPRRASRRELDGERFELISRIAGDLAHEINNPLHASIINLEVLRKRVARGRTDEADERADVIEAEIRRVHLMVDQLLRLLRPDPDAGGTVDPEEVVGEIVPLIQLRTRLAGAGFAYQPRRSRRRVRIGRDALRFTVLHLAEPLLDALRGTGGSIEVATDEADRAVCIRVIARPGKEAGGVAEAGPLEHARASLSEPKGLHPGTSHSWDRFDAAVDAAAELVRDCGGRIVRRLGEASSAAELVVLLPGIDD